ncbi:hypothetical protein [Adhaeribacter aquaticus]|uniref:hypothetical protein n=1 Tax=Adhaeribacter aquaticus TaxID=299567 RepID=UPI0004052AFA|nr:hypothetical protein [Adhaeribacter aquaticus]
MNIMQVLANPLFLTIISGSGVVCTVALLWEISVMKRRLDIEMGLRKKTSRKKWERIKDLIS